MRLPVFPFVLVGLVVALQASSLLAGPPKEPIRVFVTTQQRTDGFNDPAEKRRLRDSGAVSYNLRKQKDLTFPDHVVDADVYVEIIEAGDVNGGRTHTRVNDFGVFVPLTADTSPVADARIVVQLKCGSYNATLQSSTKQVHDSAKDVAKQVTTWIKANRERILAERSRAARSPK
jgi:hypothetical protein